MLGSASAVPQPARRDMPSAGRWIGSVVTDAKGKAVVELPMPESTTQWRLMARGCTVETLVGQAMASTVTRKDFFVTIKAPQVLQEGDKVAILARVHNLSEFAGKVDLTLRLFGGPGLDGELIEKIAEVEVGKNGSAEVLFDKIDVPLASKIRIEVKASSADKKLADALTMTLPVKPWGLEMADHAGGVSDGSETVHVKLPPSESIHRPGWKYR